MRGCAAGECPPPSPTAIPDDEPEPPTPPPPTPIPRLVGSVEEEEEDEEKQPLKSFPGAKAVFFAATLGDQSLDVGTLMLRLSWELLRMSLECGAFIRPPMLKVDSTDL